MDWFKTIKNYYAAGYYTSEQVGIFVEKGKIVAAQYKEITGQDYAE